MPTAASPTPADPHAFDHTVVAATRPDRLAVSSWLNGGPRPPTERCRVLSLGCGAGANLLPLAHYHPGSTFVGIDPSPTAIAVAVAAAETLELTNLTFASHPFTDVPPVHRLGGDFDYVILHDSLSWIGAGGRSALLSACRAALAPHGLVYVDCAAPAGWHLLPNLRRLLLGRPGGGADPFERIQRAVLTAQTLATFIPEEAEDPYLMLLAREAGQLAELTPTELTRIYLNDAELFGFGELVEMLASNGLRMVTDAELGGDSVDAFRRDGLREQLAPLELGDAAREDLIDTLTGRRFRAAIACRDDAPATEPLAADGWSQLWVASDLVPAGEAPQPTEAGGVELVSPLGIPFWIDNPEIAAALSLLGERYPAGLRLPEAIASALERVGDAATDGSTAEVAGQRLGEELLELCERGGAELRLWEPRLPTATQPWPHRLARHEAQRSGWVTTPFHTLVPLAPIARAVVIALDGEGPPEKVVGELADRVEAGELEIGIAGLTGESRSDLESGLGQVIGSLTDSFAGLGLLTSG